MRLYSPTPLGLNHEFAAAGDEWVVWSISIRGVVKGVQAVSGLALFLAVVAASTSGRAAEMEGVTLPETHSVHGAELD